MNQILIIDDEIQISRLLRLILEGAGYRVQLAENAALGLHELSMTKPDLVILDLGLPDHDGLEVLQQFREWSKVPVLVLSARPDPADKVAALDLGADDYLTKPFDAPELLARLRALLRRAFSDESEALIELGELTIDLSKHEARTASAPLSLTPIEFGLLSLLARHRGRVLTHSYLLKKIWGPKSADQAHYLRVHFAHLRSKLRAAGISGESIRNETGIGYRLVMD